jgi:hypothetical protein
MPGSSKPNLTPYAIVGVVLVLLFMYLYSRSNQSQDKMMDSTQVTTVNEFANPVKLPEPLSDEEAIARDKFIFSVSSPLNGVTLNSPNIQVTGKTVPGADVFVNEKDTKADSQGNFSVVYTLDEGENYLVVGANDEYGNFNEIELTVIYQN